MAKRTKKELRDGSKNERERPQFWLEKMQETAYRNRVPLQQWATFSRWSVGDMRELNDPQKFWNSMEEWREGLANQHALVQETARANLFFRNPQPVITCPWSRPFGVWTQGLARVETALTKETMKQAGYFIRARRRIDDALNGPYGVLKFTHDADIAIDRETIDAARLEAGEENKRFVTPPHQKMKAEEQEIHSIHIEEHEKLYAMGQTGQIPMTKAGLKYLRAHIDVHKSMRTSELPTETVEDARIIVRRKSPIEWFYDTAPDDMGDARWYAEQYLARKWDVMANEDYDKEAVKELGQSTIRFQRQGVEYPSGIPDAGPFTGSDHLVRICEVIDLVSGNVIEFAEGCQRPLSIRPYGMKSILPSGPYSVLMFRQSPFEATGVPIPTTWAREQRLLTSLASMHATAAERAIPRTVYNADVLNSEKLAQMLNAPSCDAIPLNGLRVDQKIKDVIEQLPTAEIKPESLAVEAASAARMRQLSGFGNQKLGGGDQADSATEAAIIAASSDAISEDRGAMVDRASEYDVQLMVRLQRATYPKDLVVEMVGPDALQWWPDVWSDRDIKNDRSASVVTGSSKRRNTQIDTKLMMDYVVGMAALPQFAGPAGSRIIVEMSRRIVEDNGISGLDWEELEAETQMLAMAQQAGGMGAPGGTMPGDDEGGSAEETGDEPSQAAMQQGNQNVGGGRVATGAGKGDKYKFIRGRLGNG